MPLFLFDKIKVCEVVNRHHWDSSMKDAIGKAVFRKDDFRNSMEMRYNYPRKCFTKLNIDLHKGMEFTSRENLLEPYSRITPRIIKEIREGYIIDKTGEKFLLNKIILLRTKNGNFLGEKYE